MKYLKNKKLTFMSIVNRIKGFVRSVSGIPPLILPDCVDEKSLINYTIEGNSVQNGTPTPDAPVEVENVGEYDEETGKYKIPVVCSGKNLFDKDKFKYGMHMCTVTRNDYNYTIKGSKGAPNAASSGSFQIILPKSVISQTNTFTVSINITMLEYGDINNQIRLWTIKNSTAKQNMMSQTFSLNERCRLSWTFTNADYELTGIWFYVNGNKISFEMDTLQIETNDVMTDYEPYYLPVTTSIYLDEPLRKIGNYADYIDVENQKVVRKVYEKILTGTESWTSPTPAVYCISRGYVNPQYDYSVRTNVLCTHLQPSNLNNIQGCGVSSSNLIVNYDNGDMGRTSFKQLLIDMYSTGTPMIIYYVRAEAEEIPICLPKLPTFRGTTIYTVETSVQPSEMSATYYATSKE